MRRLCAIEDIPDGGSQGFPAPGGGLIGLFAVRAGETVRVFVNSCPHLGVPLDWLPGRFLSSDGTRIVCATHGAEFRIEDGLCLRGPCAGDFLEAVPVYRDGAAVLVMDDVLA